MRDFTEEREAVKQAIESLGLRPLMAETSPASPDPSKHALVPLVEQADAVVLVLGARYGFVAEHGRSPTEDEYDHAVATGTPVLAFVQQGVDREPRQEEFVAKVQGAGATAPSRGSSRRRTSCRSASSRHWRVCRRQSRVGTLSRRRRSELGSSPQRAIAGGAGRATLCAW